jgi:hypothetical protein
MPLDALEPLRVYPDPEGGAKSTRPLLSGSLRV